IPFQCIRYARDIRSTLSFRQPKQQMPRCRIDFQRREVLFKDALPGNNVRLWHVDARIEPPPDGAVEEMLMVGGSNGEPAPLPLVETLKQCVHHALDLAELVHIIARFRYCIELIQKKKTAVAVGKIKQHADVAPRRPEKGRHQTVKTRLYTGQIEAACDMPCELRLSHT